MDSVRYYAALLLVVTFPPAFAFWFVVHPFIGFWRRLGSRTTYGVMVPGLLAAGFGLFRLRATLLSVNYGTQKVFIVLGVVLYALGVVVERKCRRHLSLRTLVGIPELEAKSRRPGELLREGIYARVRHPRYLAAMLGGAGTACVANYLATWVLMATLVPAVYLLTVLEERELRVRFGETYMRYAEQVPRLIPRLNLR